MQTYFSEKQIDYTGEQLRSRWIRTTFGVEGDCIASFVGGCDVKPEFMVDLVDIADGSSIYSPLMLHFIIEHFEADLEKAVLRQRLLAAIARDWLSGKTGLEIARDGDDLYLGERKISISIATVSPVSSLIHFAMNIRTEGVPVPASGLDELGLQAEETARSIMNLYVKELASIALAGENAKPVE